jgi:predicted RNA binding protein YcfA (HicA-like mRNA interferase family)
VPKRYSSKEVIKLKNGFVFVSQKGRHVKYKKKVNNDTLIVIVPNNKKEIPNGTFNSILKSAELK